MFILNLYGIPFHTVVVFRPEHDFLFKSPHHTVLSLQDLKRNINRNTVKRILCGSCNRPKLWVNKKPWMG